MIEEVKVSRVRLRDLKRVLREVLVERNIDEEEADEIAEKVMNLFGYDTTITDNLLSTNERDLFYMLEDYDILATEEETVILPSGKRWRIHYWRLKENKVWDILEEMEKEEEPIEEESIYKRLSDDVWKRASGSDY